MTTVSPSTSAATAALHPRIRARREAVESERRKRRSRVWLEVAGVVVAALLVFAVLKSPLFSVEEVRVIGTADHRDLVLDASGVIIGQPLIDVDLDAARRAIVALPQVSSVSATRAWDGQVELTVTEREPVAGIAMDNGDQLMVDVDGRIVGLASEGIVAPTVTITGLRAGEIDQESMAPDTDQRWVDDRALGVVEVAAEVPSDIAAMIEAMHVDSIGHSLQMRNGAHVVLGDRTELGAKFRSLRTLVLNVDLNCLQTVDLRAPSSPVLTRSDACAGY